MPWQQHRTCCPSSSPRSPATPRLRRHGPLQRQPDRGGRLRRGARVVGRDHRRGDGLRLRRPAGRAAALRRRGPHLRARPARSSRAGSRCAARPGRTAPRSRAVPLAKEARPAATGPAPRWPRRLTYGADLPLVLVVGSHEPRKNHRALLHAAERLWRDGVQFSLLFVGGNAWHSEGFVGDLEQLQRDGRPGRQRRAACPTTSCGRCTSWPGARRSRPSTRASACRWPSRWPRARRSLTSRFGSMARDRRDAAAPCSSTPATTTRSPRASHAADGPRGARRAAAGRPRVPVRSWQQYATTCGGARAPGLRRPLSRRPAPARRDRARAIGSRRQAPRPVPTCGGLAQRRRPRPGAG